MSLTTQVRQLFAEADLRLWAVVWALDHRGAGAWPAHLLVGELPRA